LGVLSSVASETGMITKMDGTINWGMKSGA
jgi:hypothetical protein